MKKYNHKANQGKVPDDKENVLNRDFKAETINQKWVTDITYIHVLREGWTYLASVMDLYDRKIIGYAYGKHQIWEANIPAICLNTICRQMDSFILSAVKEIHMTMRVSNPSTQ